MTAGSTFYSLNITKLVYDDQPNIKLPFVASKVLIISDTLTNDVELSFNGRDTEGKLLWSDEKLTFSNVEVGRIWFKANVGTGTAIRVHCWA